MLRLILNKYNILTTRCNICNLASLTIICEPCLDSLPDISKYLCCNKCKALLNITTLECSECSKYNFAFDQLYTAYSYDYPLANVLLAVKFGHQTKYIELLSRLFYLSHATNPAVDYLLPVPMHYTKYINRKFNVSYELLQTYLQHHKKPILVANKRHQTIAQVELSYTERIKNAQNTYTITQDLTGKTVAIIDDVVTTGATVNELARLCKERGASTVYVWCLMRSLIY